MFLKEIGCIFAACSIALPVSAKDMTFEYVSMNHTAEIYADGKITAKTSDDFLTFLDRESIEGFYVNVRLNSIGGSLFGGMRLGSLIRERGYNTVVGRQTVEGSIVGGECYSACAYAFLGGVGRTVNSHSIGGSSVLGFHQFRSKNTKIDFSRPVEQTLQELESETQVISSIVFEYILEMGAEPSLFSSINTTPPEDMYEPDPAIRRELNIETAEGYLDTYFEPYKSGVIAYSQHHGSKSGRQVVDQVTAYCKGGQPYLLLSAEKGSIGMSEHLISVLMEDNTKFAIGTLEDPVDIDPASISYRTGGEQLMEIALPPAAVKKFSELQEIKFWLRTYGANGSYSGYLYLTPLDQAKFNSAFNLCIG